MSADLTPKQLDNLIKEFDLPNMTDNLTVVKDGKSKPAYTDEQIEISHKYKKLGLFGFDFLMCCRQIGLLSSEEGQNLIQQIEDYFNGKDIDKEIASQAESWYNGEFVSGHCMDANNEEFAIYLKSKIQK